MRQRIKYIDFFRFLAIINMVIYHTYYDLKFVFLMKSLIFDSNIWDILQQYICISFIFLSGISCNYSSKLIKKAFKLSIISVLITIVTAHTSEDLVIYFGIIHFLTVLTIVIFFISKINVNKVNNEILFWIFVLIFIFLKSGVLYRNEFYSKIYIFMSKLPFSFVLGFPKNDFFSSDYFPIIPWIFLGVSGYYFNETKISKKIEKIFQDIKIPKIITVISQKSLIIYVFHQVVIYTVLYIYFVVYKNNIY